MWFAAAFFTTGWYLFVLVSSDVGDLVKRTTVLAAWRRR